MPDRNREQYLQEMRDEIAKKFEAASADPLRAKLKEYGIGGAKAGGRGSPSERQALMAEWQKKYPGMSTGIAGIDMLYTPIDEEGPPWGLRYRRRRLFAR